MKSLALPILGAAAALLLAAGVAAAATPTSTAATQGVAPVATTSPQAVNASASGDVIAAVLGLTNAEIVSLRQQGLSLAQIAARRNVDPQKLIDALVAQWSSRIDARLTVGAITADQAKALKANLPLEAKAMVNQTTLGGMRGSAVGAGPNGAMRGMGASGTGAAGAVGRGRGGMMRGAVTGNGACPLASTAPAG